MYGQTALSTLVHFYICMLLIYSTGYTLTLRSHTELQPGLFCNNSIWTQLASLFTHRCLAYKEAFLEKTIIIFNTLLNPCNLQNEKRISSCLLSQVSQLPSTLLSSGVGIKACWFESGVFSHKLQVNSIQFKSTWVRSCVRMRWYLLPVPKQKRKNIEDLHQKNSEIKAAKKWTHSWFPSVLWF